MTESTYAIEGGAPGKARLDRLAVMMAPVAAQLFDRVGVPEGASCIDVGCGGGHVTRALARRVGASGQVLGIDFDADVVALARADTASTALRNVEFRVAEALQLSRLGRNASFDVAYARFLLSHVADPQAVVDGMAGLVRPGGMVIVEDIEARGAFTEPPNPTFTRFIDLYRQIVRRKGGDGDVGPRLPALLRSAGLVDVGAALVQLLPDGENRHIHGLTLDRIGPALVAAGLLGDDEVAAMSTELHALADEPATLMATPRFFQAWGIVPDQRT